MGKILLIESTKKIEKIKINEKFRAYEANYYRTNDGSTCLLADKEWNRMPK